MKRIFVVSLLFVMLSAICFAQEVIFNDLDNHWAKDVIYEMATNGTISGYEDGSFNPNKEISVAEFLKILIVEEDYKLNTTGNRWPNWYINTALDNGLIKINDFDDYSKTLLRKDAVLIISNYVGLDDVQKSKLKFSDLSKENKDNILKLVNLGIFNGYQDGTFKENDPVTRAQACKIIHSAYYAKRDLTADRKYDPSQKNTNIDDAVSGDVVTKNRYTIKNKRIYINDNGRYAKLNNATLNQEYVKDDIVIKVINALVDNSSYTEVIYIPDKYIINTLNICYGERQDYVNNGIYSFQIRFYENGNYNLSKATGNSEFCEDAIMKIELDKMWTKLSEYNSDLRASKKNLKKLEKVFKSLFGEKNAKELIKYVEDKLIYASKTPDDEAEYKICEVKKIGKFTFNVLCTEGEKIQIFIKKY